MSNTHASLQAAYEGLLAAAARDLAPVWEAQEKTAGKGTSRIWNAGRALLGRPLEAGGEHIPDVIRADVGKLRSEISWDDALKQYEAAEAARNAAGEGFGGKLIDAQAEGAFGPRGQRAAAKNTPAAATGDGGGGGGNASASGGDKGPPPSPEGHSGLNWKHYAGAAGLGTLGAGGAFMVGRHQAQAEADRKRNLAFGAGLAAGVAAPSLVRGAGVMLNQAGYGRPMAGPPPALPYYSVQ